MLAHEPRQLASWLIVDVGQITMLRTWLVLFTLLVAAQVNAEEAKFSAPSPEQMRSLLRFGSPVSLSVRVVPKEEFSRKPERGVPLAVYTYFDRAHTSETLSVAVYPVGEYLKHKRTELADWITKHAAARRIADGRSIWRFPLGFGPGGSSDGVLLPSRDSRYELVVIRFIDHHDDEDQKLYAHHVKSPAELVEIILDVERLVFR